jgi:hypothetical protein
MRCPVLLGALPIVVPPSLKSRVVIAGGEAQVSPPSIVMKVRPGVAFNGRRGVGAGSRRSGKRGRGAFSWPDDARTTSKSPRKARTLPKVFIEMVCFELAAGRVFARKLRFFRFSEVRCHYALSRDRLQGRTFPYD